MTIEPGSWWRFRNKPGGFRYQVLAGRGDGGYLLRDETGTEWPCKYGTLATQMEPCPPPGTPDPDAAPAPPPPFAVGDAVRLRGHHPDNPTMTVVSVEYDGGFPHPSRDGEPQQLVHVAYVPSFGGEGKILRDSFPPAALHRLPGGAGAPEGADGPS